MKKLLVILLSILTLFLVGCGEKGETPPDKPPAFIYLAERMELVKHSEKGESMSFSEKEMTDFLGETATYITVTSLPNPENGVLMYGGAAVIKDQSLPMSKLDYLKFVPNGDCESASFGFTCDSSGYSGRELKASLIFGDSLNSPPVAADNALNTVAGIAVNGKLDIAEPNGDDFTVNVLSYPTDGFIEISPDGCFTYTPEEGFSGKDTLVYTVTDKFGAVSERATMSITVGKNESNLYFADMQDNGNHLAAYQMCSDNIMVYRFEDGSYYFDPDKTVTKMDFLVMAMCATGENKDIVATADSMVADDNGLSSGFKGYLSAAGEKGFLKLDNGRFNPKAEITISDAAYMISSMLGLPLPTASEGLDVYIAAAESAGIIEGADSLAALTKADTAKLLANVREYMEDNNMN